MKAKIKLFFSFLLVIAQFSLSCSDGSDAVYFAVIADYGRGSEAEAAEAALIRSMNPDFIITAGDNNYPSGSAETIDENIGKYFSDYIAHYRGSYGEGSFANRFFPTPGNHDLIENNGLKIMGVHISNILRCAAMSGTMISPGAPCTFSRSTAMQLSPTVLRHLQHRQSGWNKRLSPQIFPGRLHIFIIRPIHPARYMDLQRRCSGILPPGVLR